MLTGIPVIDLKAGDEVYAGVMQGLLERFETGVGKEIHVSMLQAAASWLITVLPLIDYGCQPGEITRAGNEHRKFIPTNVYPTSDGFIFMAIGSDVQWRRFTAIPKFACVANDVRHTNEGRHLQREAIHADIAQVSRRHLSAAILEDLRAATIPATRINDIRHVRELEPLSDRLTHTTLPDGREVSMQPMAVDIDGAQGNLAFAPKYGQHTRSVLAQAGLVNDEVQALYSAGVVA